MTDERNRTGSLGLDMDGQGLRGNQSATVSAPSASLRPQAAWQETPMITSQKPTGLSQPLSLPGQVFAAGQLLQSPQLLP